MLQKQVYIIVLAVFCQLFLFSQNETKKWYFGDHAGLDFSTSPPTVLTNGSLISYEGCSTISNANGNLLFYTDGTVVYNSTHAVMANGSGLLGNTSTTEGAMIIKKPGSTNIYYLFALVDAGNLNGVTYSIIDMSLAAGQGSVTAKNVPLVGSCTERMTAVRHCNGADIWLLVQPITGTIPWSASTSPPSAFYAYPITSSGIGTAVTNTLSNAGLAPFVGYLKLSPSGKKLAYAINGLVSYLYLADFDASSGIITNTVQINTGSFYNGYNYYGVEFSPDGTKLYASGTLNSTGQGFIHQWDLCAGSNSAIQGSVYTLTMVANTQLWALQTGADGKIYNARFGHNNLGVINNPNASGSACNYVHNGQSINPKFAYLGLPNFVTSSLRTPTPFTYTVNNLSGCQTATFTMPPVFQTSTLVNCAASGYSFTGLEWNFGDPASGSTNTSTVLNPIHAYSNVGTYTAQLIIHYSCGGGTDTISQQVVANQLCISLTSSAVSCSSPGTASVILNSGIGPFSYTWAPGGQTTSVITGVVPGSYTVTVYDAGNNITSTQTAVFNSPQLMSGNVNNTASLSCYGAATGTANISNLNGGSALQNYLWTNGTTNYTTTTVNGLSAGIWSVTVTDAITACSFSNAFYITQPSATTLNLSASVPTACVGSGVVLNGNATGGVPGYVYSWVNGPSASSFSVSANTGGTYIYTASSTDANNCVVTTTISVDFINNPVLTVLNASICPLETGTLVASGAQNYVWNGSVTGSTFTDNPASNSQYTVVGTALGCTNITTGFIYLKAQPVPTISNSSPVCSGQSLTMSVSGGTAGLWVGPNSFLCTSPSTLINAVTNNQAGVYTVTVTAANACTASAATTVNVVSLPNVGISASNASICANTTSTSLNSTGNATLLSWNPSFNLSSASAPIVTAFPASSQVYTLTGWLNNCSNSATVLIVVVPPPNFNLSFTSQSLCAQAFNGSPNSITLTASGANVYTISTPAYLYNTNPNGPSTGLSLNAPYLNTGPATATIIGGNGVCSLTSTVVVNVIPNPTVQLNNYLPVICAGQTFTYNSSGASTYSWSSATAGSTVLVNGNTSVSNASISSVFSVYGGSLGCNSATQNTTLTVLPLPTVSIVPNPTFVCVGNSVALTAQGNGTLFCWSPSIGLSSLIGKQITASPQSQQNYTVVASLNNCTNSAHTTVSVMPLPVATIINRSNPQQCLQSDIILEGSGGTYYSWKAPGGVTYTGSYLQIKATSMAYSGVYLLTVTDDNSCQNTSITNVIINQPPGGVLSDNLKQACVPFKGLFSLLKNQDSEPVSDIIWFVNNQSFRQNNLSYNFNVAGTYTVKTVVTGSNGCVNTLSVLVNASTKPKAEFSYSPESPVENVDEVVFLANTVSSNSLTFNWYFTDGKKTNGPISSLTYSTEGVYAVALVVKNNEGCADTLVKSILVEPDFGFYMPNAFTPNDDAYNEFFAPVMRGVSVCNFMIYNRWGHKVFDSAQDAAGWDGTYNGNACKQDVYVWKARVTTLKGKTFEYTGHVTLYR